MLNAPVIAAATAKRNRTRPAASLSRLSPSNSTISRRGNATRSNTAFAAIASGGETTAPSAKHAAHGRSGTIQRATKPTASVVNATAPIASSRIPPRFLRKSAQAVKQAPSISRGGRNKTRTSFGGEARDKCQHNAARYQRRRRRQAQDFSEQFQAENRYQQEQCELERGDGRHGRVGLRNMEPKYT